ncbi:MAG: sulfurtransferase, partial [Stenotrophomonas sp.]
MIANTAAYHFTPIADPDALCATLLARAEAAALRGTVLVAGEGINLFLAGSEAGIDGFYAALRAEPGFAGLRVKTSYS